MRPLLLFLFACQVCGQTVDSAAVDEIIEKTRQAWRAPGIAVAVVLGDDVVYLKGHGLKRMGAAGAVSPDTRFAIASTTKAFTAAALAILADRGKLTWDDPVRKHYAEFRLADPLANENVTLRDIVSHRTGLSRNDPLWYVTNLTREQLIQRIGLVPLTKPFRQTYQYQNIMFMLAGQVVGRVSGGTWESFVQANLLDPLKMTNTDFSVRDVLKAPDYATSHVKRKEAVQIIPWRHIDSIGPSGSINSSIRDLSRWLRLNMQKGVFEGTRLISAKEIGETHSPQMVIRDEGPSSRELNPDNNMAAYGLGWRLHDYRGHHLVSHGGAIDGFRSQVAFLPKDNIGMVILTNLGDNNLPEALRNTLIDQILGLPPKDWNELYLSTAERLERQRLASLAERQEKRYKNTKPSRELAAYAGAFENPGYGTARVSVDGTALKLVWENASVPLNHFHFDTFQAPDDGSTAANSQVVFRLDAKGEVASLRYLDQEWTRKEK